MAIAIGIYFLIGLLVVGILAARSSEGNRKKEISFVFMAATTMSPLFFLLGFFLWPLWLLLMMFPEETFEEGKPIPTKPRFDPLGKTGTVVLPLTPVGRVEVENHQIDARCESGNISEGTEVEIYARSISEEYLVREMYQSHRRTAARGRL